MKQAIKTILDEMIFFKMNWRKQEFEDLQFLKPIMDEMTPKEVYFCVGPILLWPKKIALFDGWDSEDDHEEDDDDDDDDFTNEYFKLDVGFETKRPQYKRFKKFFDRFIDLNLIYRLHEDRISFSDELTHAEKDEVILYIQVNFKERFRIGTQTKYF